MKINIQLKRIVPAILFLLVIGMTGCGTIEKQSTEWRKEFGEFRTNIVTAVDTLAVSIPGERERRLIEAAHSTDKGVRDNAVAMVKTLYGVDLKEAREFECSVWFDLGRKAPLMAQIFRAGSPSQKVVVNWLNNQSFNPVAVNSVIEPPPSEAQVKASVEKSIDHALELLAGAPKTIWHKPIGEAPGSYELAWPDEALAPGKSVRIDLVKAKRGQTNHEVAKDSIKARMEEAMQDRKKARNALAQAIMEAYKSNSTRTLGRAHKVLPWNILDPEPYLIVMIRKEDWEAHKEHLTVRALVHRNGDPSKAYKDLDQFELLANDFSAANKVTHPTRGEYVWAAANMTQSKVIDPGTIRQMEVLEERLKAIQLENALKKQK